jgi:D-sedoheptulose 7-phosphate isomerase
MALFSAHANDNGYESVFAEQLNALVRSGDVVIAISASGNSPNILRGVEAASALDATTIGWSGYQGGKLAQLVDLHVLVPNNCIEQIEDIHLMLGHIVTTALRQSMQRAALNSELELASPLETQPAVPLTTVLPMTHILPVRH